MKAIVVGLLVLLIVGEASAQSMLLGAGNPYHFQGFTLYEKAQARKGYDAFAQMIAAWRTLSTTMSTATGASAKAALRDVAAYIHFEGREIGLGNLLLIGVNDAMNTLEAIISREAVPRPQWVVDAFQHHDFALGNISSGIAVIDTALLVSGQPISWTANLNSIKANFTQAQTLLNGIDRSKSYLKARYLPYCPDPVNAANLVNNSSKSGACNVFGPHGNWIMATQEVAMGFQEMSLNISGERLLKIWTANDGSEPAFGDSLNPVIADMLLAFAELLNNFMTIEYNFAMIPVTATQCGFTPFQLVSRTIERFLQFGDTTDSITSPANGGPIAGNPFYFNFRTNILANLNALSAAFGTNHPVTQDLLDNLISSILVVWRFTEGGFWDSFAMPSDIYNVIIDNANSGGPPFGTTVFPYYFGITSVRDLRVYVRIVASSQNKVPKTEGVDYTVTGVGNPAGGTIVFTVPPPSDTHVMIERVWGTRLEATRRHPYAHNDPDVGTVGPCN